MTKTEIETALDNGKLWAAMANGRYWLLRRNGKTQTWKTRPDEFRIPVKAGLRSCGNVWHYNQVSVFPDVTAEFVISDTNPKG